MADIKNKAIVAILAAIAIAFNDAAATDAQKTSLKEASDQLIALDGQLDIEQTAAASQLAEASEVITDLKGQLVGALSIKADTSKKPIGVVDGVSYEVNSGAHGIGSAEDVAKNVDAMRGILKID